MKGIVYVVSKTHLDMGYTDLAQNVLNKYIEVFIPNAIKIAKQVNEKQKRFVWTLGSWLIMKALQDSNKQRVKELEDACKRGDIVAHAMPFTVQTELMDKRLLQDGLNIVKDLDKKFGRTTVAAKMTDVPGHTLGMVKILAQNGIKLLHIGVNQSSAVPEVPRCFVWKCDDAEVIVIYEGTYGKTFKSPYLDDILVFDHSMDNCGPHSVEKTIKHFNSLKKKYKGYEVVAGTLDDYADKLWDIKDKLPVVCDEIGDSWIHGVSSDPYKYGGLELLKSLREQWIEKGLLDTQSEGYKEFASNLLCLAEHTCGMGVLKGFKDYDNYLKKDFNEALRADVKIRRYGIFRIPAIRKLAIKHSKKGIYTKMEKSWAEQREYLDKAVNALPENLQNQAKEALEKLIPQSYMIPQGKEVAKGESLQIGKWSVSFNKFGAIENLSAGEKVLIKDNDKHLISYRSISYKEFNYWLKNYQRDLYKTWTWAIPDFARPKLKKVANKYPQGKFGADIRSIIKADGQNKVVVEYKGDKILIEQTGMPERFFAEYTFEDKMTLKLYWFGKQANRLPEEIWINFGLMLEDKDISYIKTGKQINPFTIVKNGSRNLSVAEKVIVQNKNTSCNIVCKQPVPVAVGEGKLLKFDNEFGDKKDGLSYLVYNNIWGTNYPLWYRDNAYFEWEFDID